MSKPGLPIDILATRDNEVLAAVTGQIIRSGIFQDKAFTEAFPFRLRWKSSMRLKAFLRKIEVPLRAA